MSVYSNSTIPGFEPESFSTFITTMTKEWNLPQDFASHAEMYFLQHLTASEICEILTCDGIEKHGEMFLPLFSKSTMQTYNRELSNPDPENPKLFWLSFRAVRYPLGTSFKHALAFPHGLKCYVLIQVDKKS